MSRCTSRIVAGVLWFAVASRAGAQAIAPSDRVTAEAWRQAIARLEPRTPDGWRRAAVADVEAVDKALRENSPIGLIPAVAAIDTNLTRAMALARARAAQVTTKGGYYATLVALGRGVGDPHAGVAFARNWNRGLAIPDAWWPGIRVQVDDSIARVSYVSPADSATWRVGDRLLACDGTTLPALAARNVLPFQFAEQPDTPDLRRSAIPRLFVDLENPFTQRPTRCLRVRSGAGDETVALQWRVRTEEDVRAFGPADTPASGRPFGLRWVGEVAWIGLPSFSGDATTSAKIRDVVAQVTEARDRVRKAPLIVFDVRGNGGGNSMNGDRIINALWSTDELKLSSARLEPIEVAWRASDDNIAYFRTYTAEREALGDAARNEAGWGRWVTRGLESAKRRGDALWVVRTGGLNPSVDRGPARPSVLPAPVALLSDGVCASACLDFADRLLALPGTQVIGRDTGADGLLMEVRSVALPSGLASFSVPQKAYVNRRRGHLMRYRADVRYDGLWLDPLVEAWVVSTVARASR